MISFMCDVWGIRDDKYIGYGNTYMKDVSKFVTEGYTRGILEQKPTIVNLQCDIDHPTQSMSDLLHLVKEFGSLEALKGKKIVMSWAYSNSYGKPLSVPQGVIGLMTRLGMDVVLAHPEGYDLLPEVVKQANDNIEEAKKNGIGGSFTMTKNMKEAFVGADIVYPKSWASKDGMIKRAELMKQKLEDKSFDMVTKEKELEQEMLKQNAEHKDWVCTEELMKTTKEGKALYMHCLPADVSGEGKCKGGVGEVDQSVFLRYRDQLYKQAGNKPYIIAAMMYLQQIGDPSKLLTKQLKCRKRKGDVNK